MKLSKSDKSLVIVVLVLVLVLTTGAVNEVIITEASNLDIETSESGIKESTFGDSIQTDDGSVNDSVDEDAKRLDKSDQPSSTGTTAQSQTLNESVTRTLQVTNKSAINQSIFEQYDVEVIDQYERLYQIHASPQAIDNLRDVPWVLDIIKPAEGDPGTTSEGVPAIGANSLQSQGITGSGVNVGILSCTGFDLRHEELSGQISAAQSFHPRTINNNGQHAHGTAVAATVADVAPGADLYLVNYASDPISYQQSINWLIENNVDTVAHSCSVYQQPDDGTGFYSQQASRAVSNGISWFDSAGNYASSHYQSQFVDTDDDGYLDLSDDGIEANKIIDRDEDLFSPELEAGDQFRAELQWDEWQTGTDIILVVYDFSDQEVVEISAPTQRNGDDPVDQLTFTVPENGNYGLAIYSEEADVTNHVELTVLTDGYTLERNVATGSVEAPAVGDDVAGVAAFEWDTGDRPGYSSAGPADDGERAIMMSAPSHVDVGVYSSDWWIFEFGGFSGTSAAAPHAAGVAALLAELDHNITVQEQYNTITAGANGVGSSGHDIYSGAGHLNATGAVNQLKPAVAAAKPSITLDSAPSETNQASTFDVSYTIENIGDNPGSFTLTVPEASGVTVSDISGDIQSSDTNSSPPVALTNSAHANGDTLSVTVTYSVASDASAGDVDLDLTANQPIDDTTDSVTTSVSIQPSGGIQLRATDIPQTVQSDATFSVTYEVKNTGKTSNAYTIETAVDRDNVTVTDFSGNIQSSAVDNQPPSASTDLIDGEESGTVIVEYRVGADTNGNATLTATAIEPISGGQTSLSREIPIQATPEDPTERALQIAGKGDPSELTQNDVTATITRFERGLSVNGITITQNDVTATITLFGRSEGDSENTGTDAESRAKTYLSENAGNLYSGELVDRTGQDEVTISVGGGDNGFAFDSPGVVVSTGTTVIWKWTGEGGGHNISPNDPTDFENFGSEAIVDEAGYTVETTFNESGAALYVCIPHRAQGEYGAVAVVDE
jgi:halocyanin-like protein